MTHYLIFFPILLSIFLAGFVSNSSGLLIDPFETHIDINQTIDPKETVLLSMEKTEPDKRLGFRLFQIGDDALKVRVINPHGNITETTITYHTDESYGENGRVNISTEFEPKFSGVYKIELQNISDLPVSVNGYHGIMMSNDEIREIHQKYGYDDEHNTFIGFVLIGLVSGAIGVGGSYIIFRLKRK